LHASDRKRTKNFQGKGEIRTLGTLSRSAVFKTAALNRSATFPRAWILLHCQDVVLDG
jgi:hypothetical protein